MTEAPPKLCKSCQRPIETWTWRDPLRCLACYLRLKRGQVLVCTERDVRVGDVMPARGRRFRDP